MQIHQLWFLGNLILVYPFKAQWKAQINAVCAVNKLRSSTWVLWESLKTGIEGFHQVGFLVCGGLVWFYWVLVFWLCVVFLCLCFFFVFKPFDSAKTWLGKWFRVKLGTHYHLKLNFGPFCQVCNLLPFVWSKGQISLSFWRLQRYFLLFWLAECIYLELSDTEGSDDLATAF